VNGFKGPFNADMEDDPSSSAGFEDVTGNVIWDAEDIAAVTIVDGSGDPIESTLVLQPGATNVPIAGLLIDPKSEEYLFESLYHHVYSNIDDETISPLDNLRVVLDDGDGVYNPVSDVIVTHSFSLGFSDDPTGLEFLSPAGFTTEGVAWIIADVPSSVPLGTSISAQFDFEYPYPTYTQSPFPHLPPVRNIRIGGIEEPTIQDAWINNWGQTLGFFSFDQLVIQGSNLDQASNITVSFYDGSGSTSFSGDVAVSADGRFISGVDLSQAPFGFFKVEVTLTGPSGPPRTFRLSSEFEFFSP
ncbi:MAG: hypothetical protein KDB07_09820, partial [Planctomycetes bacterium]|nr:hypothetical protein [Planctomycetota bacterium]